MMLFAFSYHEASTRLLPTCCQPGHSTSAARGAELDLVVVPVPSPHHGARTILYIVDYTSTAVRPRVRRVVESRASEARRIGSSAEASLQLYNLKTARAAR